MIFGVVQQQGRPKLRYEESANESVGDFLDRTLLFEGTVQCSNPSGQLTNAIEVVPDCVILGRN